MPSLPSHECSESHLACSGLRNASRSKGVKDPDNLPFMFCPTGADTAALLVHGFTASPWEMRLLAEHLAKSGIASLAVCLPGHGTTPEDLAGRSWEEWYTAVLDGYKILSSEYRSVYAVGMSTGALLTLVLATQLELSGLVLFSPYLRVRHKLAPQAGWLRWFRPYVHTSDDIDGHYYNRRPVAGVHQINRLIKHVREKLSRVDCPVLAFNSEGDQTIDIDSGRELFEGLASRDKKYERFGPDVPHVLTREENPYREEMFCATRQFIQRQAASDDVPVR